MKSDLNFNIGWARLRPRPYRWPRHFRWKRASKFDLAVVCEGYERIYKDAMAAHRLTADERDVLAGALKELIDALDAKDLARADKAIGGARVVLALQRL